jgi:hypothetical protein
MSRRTNLLVQGSQPICCDYDALNRPNGSFTTYQYDGLNRLIAL